MLDQLAYDLRDALRALKRTPGITLTAIALIAMVIGANTTIFSMVHGLLTKQAPGVHAERLVTLASIIDGRLFGPEDSYPNYLDYVAQSKTLRSLTGYQWNRFTVATSDSSYAVYGVLVSASYFDTLGIRFERGRAFTREESQRDASGLVAVISHRLWQNQLQGADDIIGKAIVVNGHATTVVGVAPARFNGVMLAESADVWLPLPTYARIHDIESVFNDRRGAGPFFIIGQLAPHASLSQARAELALISKRLEAAYPTTNRKRVTTVFPYFMLGTGSGVYQQGPIFMVILSLITLLTVMIVCANVANLMLARVVVRQREMAVRQSLGASRVRIVRTLFAEGLLVSVAACVSACLAAWWVSRGIARFMGTTEVGMRIAPDFTPDWEVVAYAMGLALVATVASTLAPAVRAYRQVVLPWLKAGEQGIVQGRSTLSGALVVLQLAFAVVLLTHAGLAYRSLSLIDAGNLGFDKDQLLIVTVNTTARATNPATNMALIDWLRTRLQAAPGVLSVTHVGNAMSFGGRDAIRRPGVEEPVLASGNEVGPDFLRTLGIAPLAGREFVQQDGTRANRLILINQNLANALWPGRSAIGETLQFGANRRPFEVIGVVPNAYFEIVSDVPHPNMFLVSQHQQPPSPGHANFYVRYAGTFDSITPAVRRALHDADAQVPIVYMRSMDTQLASVTSTGRIVTTLLAFFALSSLAIAAIGQYAVMAFNMRRRTRDFGVRIALGASSRQILTTVIGEGCRLTLAGLAIGFALSFATSAAFRSLLVGVTPTDGPTYLGVLTLLAIASLTACYLPALRAARIDPIEALRQE